MKKISLLGLIVVMLSSCVSSRIHKDLQKKFSDLQEENTQMRRENESLTARLNEAEKEIEKLTKQRKEAEQESKAMEEKFRNMLSKYQELNRSYEYLLENNNEMLANNQKENQKLVQKLNKLQKELGSKEDSLRTEQNRLEYLSAQLQEREARVHELESLIAKKDSTVNSVRTRLKDALLNFDGKGLTVEIRNGKVYVSLENSLLFPSASWDVNKEGKKALRELAKVLAENPDLNVMVEGHTDSDAFRGSTAVKDNWDLSVMRATSIVKIITENEGVNRSNITAAGRSEYLPIADNDSEEGKAKNRRTEIIITPNLSELTDLLEESNL